MPHAQFSDLSTRAAVRGCIRITLLRVRYRYPIVMLPKKLPKLGKGPRLPNLGFPLVTCPLAFLDDVSTGNRAGEVAVVARKHG